MVEKVSEANTQSMDLGLQVNYKHMVIFQVIDLPDYPDAT